MQTTGKFCEPITQAENCISWSNLYTNSVQNTPINVISCVIGSLIYRTPPSSHIALNFTDNYNSCRVKMKGNFNSNKLMGGER